MGTRAFHNQAASRPAAPRGGGDGPSRTQRQRAWLALGLALVTLVVFLPATRCGFVDYDDGDYVTGNARVQAGLSWAGVRWAFTTGHASNWHPLTWLSHMLDAQLWGMSPAGHHLTSVLLHAANAALVFLVLARLTSATGRSLAVAALFALHPLRVESVAWVSERKDVLSMGFGLLAILAYARYARGAGQQLKSEVRSPKSEGERAWPAYLVALLCFALSLMSKPMFVTLPCLLLLLDYWPLGRLTPQPDRSSAETAGGRKWRRIGLPANWRALLVEKLPFFALAAASSVVTFLVQRRGGAVAPVAGLPLDVRVENAVVSYARYLLKTAWPVDLAVLYPHPGHWPVAVVVAATVLLLTVSGLALARRRAWPFAFVGWFWYVGTLVPVIGLVQVGIQSMADRYTYLPSVGLLVAVVWAAEAAWRGLRSEPRLLAAGAICAALVCAGLTRWQIGFWTNTETLFRRTVAVTRDNYLAHNNLGFYFGNQGRQAEAVAEYRESLRIKPDYLDALNNLGRALGEQGHHQEALALLEAALRQRPRHAEVNNNYGNVLANMGRLEEALVHYRIALEEKPDHADAHNNMAVALAMMGRQEEALEHMRQAVRLRPGHAASHSNLGNVLATAGRWAEALEEFRLALQLNPNEAQAHNNVANVLAELGRLDEAERHYRRALELNARNPEAHFNLGLLLARKGQRDAAIEQLRQAVRLKPDYAEARSQLQRLGGSDAP